MRAVAHPHKRLADTPVHQSENRQANRPHDSAKCTRESRQSNQITVTEGRETFGRDVRKPEQCISTVYFGDVVVTSGYSIVAIRLSFALVYPSPITAASLQLQGLMPMNFCFGFLVSDLPFSLTTADASQRKESPMKTEISLLAALLALAIYAGGLIMLLVYIVHSFWLVTPQANPFCCF